MKLDAAQCFLYTHAAEKNIYLWHPQWYFTKCAINWVQSVQYYLHPSLIFFLQFLISDNYNTAALQNQKAVYLLTVCIIHEHIKPKSHWRNVNKSRHSLHSSCLSPHPLVIICTSFFFIYILHCFERITKSLNWPSRWRQAMYFKHCTPKLDGAPVMYSPSHERPRWNSEY